MFIYSPSFLSLVFFAVLCLSAGHEIRTPANAIIGATELCRLTALNSEQQELVEMVYSSSKNLLTIINDILDFSKIESGNLDLDVHLFDLAQCVEEALDLITIRASEKNIELSYFIHPETPRLLLGDSGRVRQILANFLSNAVKFTNHGFIEIKVQLYNPQSLQQVVPLDISSASTTTTTSTLPVFVAEMMTDRPLNKSGASKVALQFSVQDTGVGIPADSI